VLGLIVNLVHQHRNRPHPEPRGDNQPQQIYLAVQS